MQIKTFGELIDWTRDLHQNLARCLAHCSTLHDEERARALLDYLSSHEAELARIIDGFEHQSVPRALETRVYDYLKHSPIKTHETCDGAFSRKDSQEIFREVIDFHEQVMDLYKILSEKAEIPEARELLEQLLEMEKNETMRLARQVGRMDDL
ncbi:ATPase [Halopseudomonas sp.]|uniref:ATPase n=1 Tax=Halopseudomonas sp. TaxID=2901191 RepID=UPI0035622269